METVSNEEKIELKISPRNIPYVISALEAEIEHLKKNTEGVRQEKAVSGRQ